MPVWVESCEPFSSGFYLLETVCTAALSVRKLNQRSFLHPAHQNGCWCGCHIERFGNIRTSKALLRAIVLIQRENMRRSFRLEAQSSELSSCMKDCFLSSRIVSGSPKDCFFSGGMLFSTATPKFKLKSVTMHFKLTEWRYSQKLPHDPRDQTASSS